MLSGSGRQWPWRSTQRPELTLSRSQPARPGLRGAAAAATADGTARRSAGCSGGDRRVGVRAVRRAAARCNRTVGRGTATAHACVRAVDACDAAATAAHARAPDRARCGRRTEPASHACGARCVRGAAVGHAAGSATVTHRRDRARAGHGRRPSIRRKRWPHALRGAGSTASSRIGLSVHQRQSWRTVRRRQRPTDRATDRAIEFARTALVWSARSAARRRRSLGDDTQRTRRAADSRGPTHAAQVLPCCRASVGGRCRFRPPPSRTTLRHLCVMLRCGTLRRSQLRPLLH